MKVDDLSFGEWRRGVWYVRIQMAFCGLRGHLWGPWWYDVPYEEGGGDSTRMCQRCDAWEQRTS